MAVSDLLREYLDQSLFFMIDMKNEGVELLERDKLSHQWACVGSDILRGIYDLDDMIPKFFELTKKMEEGQYLPVWYKAVVSRVDYFMSLPKSIRSNPHKYPKYGLFCQ